MRELIGIGLILLLASFALELLGALAPVAVGFLAAYFVAPVVHWFEERGLPRGWVVLGTTVIGLGASAGVLAVTVPRAVKEIARLKARLPRYLEVLENVTGLESSELLHSFDPTKAMDRVQPMLGLVGALVGTTAHGLLFVVLTIASFVVFNLELERLPLLKSYIPRSQRERLEPMVDTFIEVFRGYLRGQVVVMFFTGTVYSIGFSLLGTPFGFLAGIVGGVFSIIPYGQLAGPALAIIFNLFESEVGSGGFDGVHIFVWPLVVYAVMQSLESFVVTPLVQGAATRLHPLAILACLAAGGTIGGLVGVFLAIPTTASLWIIAQRQLIPAWKDWADES